MREYEYGFSEMMMGLMMMAIVGSVARVFLQEGEKKLVRRLLLEDKIYEKVAPLADAFDDSRINLWIGLRLYKEGYDRDEEWFMKQGIEQAELAERDIGNLVAKALEKIRDIPEYSEVKALAEEAVETFRSQARKIREMMEKREDWYDILEMQTEKFEQKQFDLQHKLLLHAYLKYKL